MMKMRLGNAQWDKSSVAKVRLYTLVQGFFKVEAHPRITTFHADYASVGPLLNVCPEVL